LINFDNNPTFEDEENDEEDGLSNVKSS
jgi:hypothetical protein